MRSKGESIIKCALVGAVEEKISVRSQQDQKGPLSRANLQSYTSNERRSLAHLAVLNGKITNNFMSLLIIMGYT